MACAGLRHPAGDAAQPAHHVAQAATMSLYRAMGRQWLWYTVTASDQVQIDVARPEMVDLLNFGNLMTPVIIALCGNSPVFGGKPSPYCSAREGDGQHLQLGAPPRHAGASVRRHRRLRGHDGRDDLSHRAR
ncbi:MAG: glutamate-cysteine ligase family protein [Caldilineaceae bacterium]